MGIQSRGSNDYLHSDVILAKITEFDIFKHYCPNFKEVGKKFKSDLRVDNSPTVAIAKINGRLVYKDFGEPSHTFNCFGYVMYKHSVDFLGCLKVISSDFGLNLSGEMGGFKSARTYGLDVYEKISEKNHSEIKVRKRSFEQKDLNFWGMFGVTPKVLLTFEVHPIDYFWINGNRFKCKDLSYVYNFKSGVKIYSPKDLDCKWVSNVSEDCIQGYDQLKQTGEKVVITSSLKDVMSLHELGYQAVALQSEMHFPKQELIDDLKSRFEYVSVLYDNDFDKERNPGQTMATKICEQYNLFNVCIPDLYKSKDISDLIMNHGLEEASNFLKSTYYGYTVLH